MVLRAQDMLYGVLERGNFPSVEKHIRSFALWASIKVAVHNIARNIRCLRSCAERIGCRDVYLCVIRRIIRAEFKDFRITTLADIEVLQRTNSKSMTARVEHYKSKNEDPRFMCVR
jgi:hypothetical protein